MMMGAMADEVSSKLVHKNYDEAPLYFVVNKKKKAIGSFRRVFKQNYISARLINENITPSLLQKFPVKPINRSTMTAEITCQNSRRRRAARRSCGGFSPLLLMLLLCILSTAVVDRASAFGIVGRVLASKQVFRGMTDGGRDSNTMTEIASAVDGEIFANAFLDNKNEMNPVVDATDQLLVSAMSTSSSLPAEINKYTLVESVSTSSPPLTFSKFLTMQVLPSCSRWPV
jgi:hypothetical protein